MFLFIDTETSGLPDFSLPITHPYQPHIVQIAAWLGEWDEEAGGDIAPPLRHVASLNAIIRPTDWTIHPHAERVHGISLERARAVGEDLADVLRRFLELVALADEDGLGVHGTLVAHNLSFDQRMIMRDGATIGANPGQSLGLLRPFCTMRALTDRMKLPSRFPGKYKWPSLTESHQFCFGRDFGDKHSAMGDLLACRDIYMHGCNQEWWK